MKQQIVAIGGGGFSKEPENALIEKYILNLSTVKNPKICFIPTASGDEEAYINQFYDFFKTQPCIPSHLSLFRGITSDISSMVLNQNIIYVGGGNTKNLLSLWRDWGLDHILHQAWKQGLILSGVSAGSICWFEEGVTDSIPGRLSSIKCLGFLEGSHCPHYDGEVERRPSYHQLLKSGRIKPGLAAEDGVAFHFIGNQLFKAISSHPGKQGYQVGIQNEIVVENAINPIYLGHSHLHEEKK